MLGFTWINVDNTSINAANSICDRHSLHAYFFACAAVPSDNQICVH